MTKLTLSLGDKKEPSSDSDSSEAELSQEDAFNDEVGVIATVLWTALCSAQSGGAKITRNAVAVACTDVMLKVTAAHAKYTGQEDRLIAYLDL